MSRAANRVNRECGLAAPFGGGSGELLGHVVNINNMVSVKLHFHPATNLICAKGIINQHSDVKLRSNLFNLNPHSLDVGLITKFYPKYQFSKVAGFQTLATLLRRN
jgi:hypothetical protein